MTPLVLRLAIAALSVLTCCSCCAKTPPRISGTVTVAPPAADLSAADLSGVVSLIGGKGEMAQGCPIAPDKALTNAHVVGDFVRYTWEMCPAGVQSSGPGCTLGLLGEPKTTVKDLFRDLGYVVPYKGTFPRWYRIAQEQPQPGDKVKFRGWDFRKRKDAFAPRDFEATVIRIRNGHVIYWPPGVQGTSGSCVLNARNEVVGINAFGHGLEDSSTAGGAVGVWPPLLELGR